MNTNFNVSAFAALQAKARTIFIDTINNLKIVQQLCEEMSSLVSSADSGLAGSWSGVAQVLNEPINSANMIFDGVNNAMTKYAADVIANEEKEMQNLDKYNSSISSLTGAAKILSESINGGSSENDGFVNIADKIITDNSDYFDMINEGSITTKYAPPDMFPGNNRITPDISIIDPVPVYAAPDASPDKGRIIPDISIIDPVPMYAAPDASPGIDLNFDKSSDYDKYKITP